MNDAEIKAARRSVAWGMVHGKVRFPWNQLDFEKDLLHDFPRTPAAIAHDHRLRSRINDFLDPAPGPAVDPGRPESVPVLCVSCHAPILLCKCWAGSPIPNNQ